MAQSAQRSQFLRRKGSCGQIQQMLAKLLPALPQSMEQIAKCALEGFCATPLDGEQNALHMGFQIRRPARRQMSEIIEISLGVFRGGEARTETRAGIEKRRLESVGGNFNRAIAGFLYESLAHD